MKKLKLNVFRENKFQLFEIQAIQTNYRHCDDDCEERAGGRSNLQVKNGDKTINMGISPVGRNDGKKKFSVARCFLYCISILFFSSCQNLSQQYHLEGFAQGTYYNIRYYDCQNRNLKIQIDSLLDDFNKTASIYDSSSIILKVNQNEDVLLNADFVEIFNSAMKVSKNTHGAFDITVGQLVNAWGFGSEERQDPPRELIDSLLQIVGYQNINIENNKIIKKYPGIKIDFNAIAKGYSVDLLSRFLQRKGIKNFIVEIGGEIRTCGKKPDGSFWNIGIEKPAQNNSSQREVQMIISLSGKSIATSGTYRKYYEKDGIRYSHTIDPKTGYPVSHTLLSATVLADDCATADAYATAFMVMGLKKSLEFLKQHSEPQAFFIFEQDGNLKTYATKGMKKMIND